MASDTTVCPECSLVYVGGEIFCPVDGARLGVSGVSRNIEPPRDPLIGAVLSGRYKIVRRIGEGGMGIVYEAEHVVIEKRVGLKVLREDFTNRPDVVERFRQEAKSASRIGHENIIDISDFGVTDAGAHYFVMELLHGHDLAVELEKKGPLSPERAVSIVMACARALGAAHAKGIVHRDMKPENIFLCARQSGEDFVKIVDFGIAKMSDLDGPGTNGPKLTKTGMIFGTPEYMSPEQAGGKNLDHRVDVYALGVILYELISGRVPFVGDTFMGILTAHVLEPVPPLKSVNPRAAATPELEAVIVRALAKSAAERIQSMDEFARELAMLGNLSGAASAGTISQPLPLPGTVTHYGSQAPGPSVDTPRPALSHPPASLAPRGAKRPLLWAGAGALLAALAVGAAIVALTREPPRVRGSDAEPADAKPLTQPPTPTPAAVVPAAPTPIAPAPAPAPAAPKETRVVVELEPTEATLTVDGRAACSGSPCSFVAAPGSSVLLHASHGGYKPFDLAVQVGSDGQVVSVKLKRKSSGPKPNGELMDVPQLSHDAFGR